MLHQLGQDIELASTVRPTQILCLLVSNHLSLEVEREDASFQLLRLDTFECVIILAFFKHSTKSLQDQVIASVGWGDMAKSFLNFCTVLD